MVDDNNTSLKNCPKQKENLSSIEKGGTAFFTSLLTCFYTNWWGDDKLN